jgi:hypothetical protein
MRVCDALWRRALVSYARCAIGRRRRPRATDKLARSGLISYHLIASSGVSWDAWRCGVGVAPAGAGRTSPCARGSPGSPSEPTTGLCRSCRLDAGQANGGKPPGWRPAGLRPSPRKNGPRVQNRHGGASKGVSAASDRRRSGDHAAAIATMLRLSGLRLPRLFGRLEQPADHAISIAGADRACPKPVVIPFTFEEFATWRGSPHGTMRI